MLATTLTTRRPRRLLSRKSSDEEKTPLLQSQSITSNLSIVAQTTLDQFGSNLQHGKNGDQSRSCIICVGSTGTGKSSTIAKCSGNDVPSGNGRDRVTVRCSVYDDNYDTNEGMDDNAFGLVKRRSRLAWVDTVGWDDVDLRDDHTFKDILRFILAENLLRVKAIVWTVLPNVRLDALLARQAAMIDMFKPKHIWGHVLIVCKQSRNPWQDTQGALAAVKAFNAEVSVPVLGFTYLSDSGITIEQRRRFQDPEARQAFFVLSDTEVRSAFNSALRLLPKEPLQVVFKDEQCKDCGERGDPRLMSNFCHLDKIKVHTEELELFHPGNVVPFHPSKEILYHHPGVVSRPWFGIDCLCCSFAKERYSCCHALPDARGCTAIRACCRRELSDTSDLGCEKRFDCCLTNVDKKALVRGCRSRYGCCHGESGSPGCTDVCSKCGRKWGTAANGCFERSHNVVSIDQL